MAVYEDLPWTKCVFKQYRPHLTSFVDNFIVMPIREYSTRKVVIRAPVKSGKREMVEYSSVSLAEYSHYFVSAFHRIADESQRLEMAEYSITVVSRIIETQVEKLFKKIQQDLNDDKLCVIHIDECDYGSGDSQGLSKIWDFVDNNPAIILILYSATPSEVHVGNMMDENLTGLDHLLVSPDDSTIIEPYTPPNNFCGPKKFLQEGLVFEATPFLDGTRITQQGCDIFTGLLDNIKIDPIRNVIILRLVGGKTKSKKPYYTFLQNLDKFQELFLPNNKTLQVKVPGGKEKGLKKVFKHFYLDFNEIDWSQPGYWDTVMTGVPILIVLDQTSTRSTEWKCHNRVFAYHDFRNTITFSTISQAQERVNHYVSNIGKGYTEFQPIKVYGCRKVWLLSAGQISYNEFLNTEWKKRKIPNTDTYKIFNSTETNMRHPIYNGEYSTSEADEILASLGCSKQDIKLSSRIKGKSYNIRKVDCSFKECNENTFTETVRTNFPGKVFLNPFEDNNSRPSGAGDKWKGVVRSDYKVLDFNTDLNDARWGINISSRQRATICYNNDVLGVCFRFFTDQFEVTNNFELVSSMYK